MGYVYRNGKGRPTNLKLAADWYKKAAGCGEANSVYILSQMYLNGEGVKPDRIESYALLLLASNTLPKAKQEAASMQASLGASEIKKAEAESKEFVPKNRPRLCLWD